MADVNGDGLKDIVGYYSSYQLVSLADGNGGFNSPQMFYAGLGGTVKGSFNFFSNLP